jgi:hypothetical protein
MIIALLLTTHVLAASVYLKNASDDLFICEIRAGKESPSPCDRTSFIPTVTRQ